MQAKDVKRSDMAGDSGRSVRLSPHVFAGLMACAGPLLAQTPPAASHVIAATEQFVRDNERIVILRQELRKSEEQLEQLVRRKAERLAVFDMQAAKEAEDQHARTLDDISALKRELTPSSRAAGQAGVLKPIDVHASRRHAVANKGKPPALWWDVYGHGHGRGAAVPAVTSLAPLREPSE